MSDIVLIVESALILASHLVQLLYIFYKELDLQQYIGVLVHRDIFCHDTNILY